MRLLVMVLLLGVCGVCSVFLFYSHLANAYDLNRLGDMRQRTMVVDRNLNEIGKLHGENRLVVSIKDVSPFFVKALLAREDTRFYRHGGVDYIGIARALVRDIKERRFVQGASTITMQLARNSFDDLSAKTAHRKMTEVMLARRIEAVKEKDEILELYVNRIFFGTGLYGIERATQAYFGKSAAQMTLGEGAMMAGIIRSPNRFSPFRNYQGALKERDMVLKRMVEKKFITQAEADQAKLEEIIVAAQPVFRSQDNYSMEAIRKELDVILSEEDIEDGGLVVYTTLDLRLQGAAEKALASRLSEIEKLKEYAHPTKAEFDSTADPQKLPPSTPYLQGSLVLVDNATGGVLASVGGRDYTQSHFDRAQQSVRPIGSTIKPFVYAAAFEQGMLPGTLLEDAPIRRGEILDSNAYWNPQNSDGTYLGWVPASVGLVRSRNAMTVRAGNYAGLDPVIDLLVQTGVGKPENRTPQIYIGNMGSNLRTLTSAMTVFPNDGIKRRAFTIQRIENLDGEIIYKTPVLEADVMSQGVARMIRRLMHEVMDKGTGSIARSTYGFKAPAGGKTGTTNDYKDAWFVGYTQDYTCGVWVGLDQPKTIIGGGYGARLSLPIWCDVMKEAIQLGGANSVAKAEPVDPELQLCRVSSLLSTRYCRDQGEEYTDRIPSDVAPREFCHVHGPAPSAPPARREREPRRDEESGFFNRFFRWMR